MSPIHVSASICSEDHLQDPCLRIQVSASICISGSSARSMSPEPYISIHIYLRILCKIHVSRLMSQHLRISEFSTRSMSSDPCLSIFVSRDPLQDPCLRFMSQHPCVVRILCKIHVSGSMSQHPFLRILCKIHVSGPMSQHPFVSQDPLQDPCLQFMSQHPCVVRILCKIHVSGSMSQHLYISGSSARSMSPIHVSASLYLRILCKIHVSGSMCPIHVLASTNMDPLQDPCLRIHVSASICSEDPLQDPCLRIQVSASICISGSSARSMSPDPCLRFMSQHPLIRIRCMIHVSVFMSRHPYLWILSKIRISAFIHVDPAQNRHGARFLWPCAGKTLRPRSCVMFRAGETHILTCRDAFFVALRRRNAHFDLPRRIFCGPAQAKRKFDLPRHVLFVSISISCGFTRSHDQMNENRHGATARDQKIYPAHVSRRQTQILTSGGAFFVALRSENRAEQKFAPRPTRLYPYRKNPSVCHTVWGKKMKKGEADMNVFGRYKCRRAKVYHIAILF